jgi:predicted MFS family arabinose efflux permease
MKNSNSVLGMPRQIVWGYIGIIIFMMGDGLEIGWLSPWLHENGFSVKETSALFSCYGVTVALASWFSGVFAEALGGKKNNDTWFILLYYRDNLFCWICHSIK